MKSPNPDRLETHLVTMLGLPVAERRAHFTRLTESEPALGAALEPLLRRFSPFDEKAEPHAAPPEHFSWLTTEVGGERYDPAGGRDVTLSHEDPTQVDRFQVIKKIGEGGMGRVYLAEEPESGRQVALKIINHGIMSLAVTERFRQEYQALAMMNHASVARLYEVGTDANRDLYFTMEYVPGKPITTYCQTHHLSLKQKILLFLQVCHGVRHAHRKAVLHRDLKPNNILVMEEAGVPAAKVIDFGLAKQLAPVFKETRDDTKVGTIVGTPSYLAPELLCFDNNRPDVRGDIYALGVVLYEMLSGTHPFEQCRGMNFDDLREAIRAGVSVPPGKLRRRNDPGAVVPRAEAIPRELDLIVMKAMEPELERRYGGLAELINDLEAFLDQRPVTAVPPGMGYRLGKFVKRNKRMVAAAVFVLAVSLTATVMVAVSAVEAREAHIRTDQALKKANTAISLLSDMLSAPDPRNQGRNARVVDLLASVEGRLGHIGDEEAILRNLLGKTYFGLGAYEEAEIHLSAAEAVFRDSRDVEAWAGVAFQLNLVRARQGRQTEAYDGFQAMERRLAPYAQKYPEPYYQAVFGQAITLVNQGRFEEARTAYRRALEGQSLLLGAEHPDTVKTLVGLATCYEKLDMPEQAEVFYRDALARQQRLLAPNHVEILATRHNYANLLAKLGKDREAVSLMRRTHDSRKEVLGEDHPLTVSSRYNLAVYLQRLGMDAEALRCMEDVVHSRWRSLGEGHADTLRARYTLATMTGRMGRMQEAEAHLAELAEASRRFQPDNQKLLEMALNARGHFLIEMERYDQALPILETAFDLRLRTHGAEAPYTLRSQANLGEAYRRTGDVATALFMIRDAWLQLPDSGPTIGVMYADCLAAAGRFDEAECLLQSWLTEACEGDDDTYLEAARVLASLPERRDLQAAR